MLAGSAAAQPVVTERDQYAAEELCKPFRGLKRVVSMSEDIDHHGKTRRIMVECRDGSYVSRWKTVK